MRHSDLVRLARNWLIQRFECVFVLTESGTTERPDAIGWTRNGLSVLIECKRSRKDFTDEWRKKRCRAIQPMGMGTTRIYLAPQGLLVPGDVEGTGWGLATVWPGQITLIQDSQVFRADRDAEMRLIMSSFANGKHEAQRGPIQLGFRSQW